MCNKLKEDFRMEKLKLKVECVGRADIRYLVKTKQDVLYSTLLDRILELHAEEKADKS